MEITLAITGASGAIYPHRLLNLLAAEPSVSRINLIASRAALRVLNDELALAADVFDIEPVALDSPMLGRHNVVHTPHNAGRTRDANLAWVDDQIARFKPR